MEDATETVQQQGNPVKMFLYLPVVSSARAGVHVFMGCLIVWLVVACSNQYTCLEKDALLPWMSESN